MQQDDTKNPPTKEAPGERALRQQFPALYITLVSIVVALAVEGLLGRLDSLSGSTTGFDLAIVVVQIGQFVLMAAVFWWISARWVTTAPWRFGIFDGLSMILLLIAFHFVSQAIGKSFGQWMFSFGIFAVAASFAYRFNGRRGREPAPHSCFVSGSPARVVTFDLFRD